MGEKENSVKRACLEYLAARGVFAWSNNTGAVRVDGKRFVRFGMKGSPDILGVTNGGRILCVETKSERGRQTAEQREFEEAVRERGGVYVVAKSVLDLQEAGL
jgi:hypothetical protein